MQLNKIRQYNQPLADILYRHQMTYCQLAKLLQVAPNSVLNFIYGRNTPSFGFMMRLYMTLKLTEKEMIAIFFDPQSSLPHVNSYKKSLMRKEEKGDKNES